MTSKSKIASKAKSPGSPALSPKEESYTLTEPRIAALTAEANALGSALPAFPGRLAQRIRRSGEIRLAAERDAADLVRTPFHNAPPLTSLEITTQRDRIEFLRQSESKFQALRSSQKDAFTQFETLGSEAAAIRTRLLRTFDLRFTDDTNGKKRLSDIRKGEGDPDLVQDVSDILLLCDEQKVYLASCPRDEAADVAKLRELSPKLSHLLAAKGMSEEAQKARQFRDASYALVMKTETRLRAAASYWYDGTEKMKDYAAFVAPTKGSPADEAADAEAEGTSPAAPPKAGEAQP